MKTRILVVGGEESARGALTEILTEDGHEITESQNAEEALAFYKANPFPIVVCGAGGGRISGVDLLQAVKSIDPDALVIAMAEDAENEPAMEMLRAGAYDILCVSPDATDRVSAVVNRAVDRVRLHGDNLNLMQRLKHYANELEGLNKKLKSMVNRDGLTSLYNRRYFSHALEVELERSRRHGRPFSLIFIDIDHFKLYNDTQGHLAGDEALRTVAKLIRERSRKTTVTARFGGEEFILLVPEADKSGAMKFADLLRTIIEEHPFEGEETQPSGNITVSMGVATHPEDGDESTALLDHADKALYEAKHAGRNRVCSWKKEGSGLASQRSAKARSVEMQDLTPH